MPINDYSPSNLIDAIVFDCDGTLSHIEGIDELAKENGVGEQVIRLTAEAMGRTGMNPELYEQRLNLVQPTAKQVQALIHQYFQHQAPDLLPTLQILQSLGKTIYIASAGLYPAVLGFAALLNIPSAHVFAVDIYFDARDHYRDFERNSPLIHADGKQKIVQLLKQRHPHLAFVGDGLNDYETQPLISRFIGYGGAFYRESIAQRCSFYISAPSMVPLLAYCLTQAEVSHLTTGALSYYNKGLALMDIDMTVRNNAE